jgi:hypothetical protein
VLPQIAGSLRRVPLDDHAPSIAEVALCLLVCPTLGISCEGPDLRGPMFMTTQPRSAPTMMLRLFSNGPSSASSPCSTPPDSTRP